MVIETPLHPAVVPQRRAKLAAEIRRLTATRVLKDDESETIQTVLGWLEGAK